MTGQPALTRSFTDARSAGERLRSRERAGVTTNGTDGWLSTGAATWPSTIIARAKPPVKHMPRAPTPGPPSSSCSEAARARVQVAMGDVLLVARAVNSLEMQTWASDFTMAPVDISRPGVPKSDGMTTVKPASTTSSAKACTFGVMPGISWMTTTPGPVPRRNTG